MSVSISFVYVSYYLFIFFLLCDNFPSANEQRADELIPENGSFYYCYAPTTPQLSTHYDEDPFDLKFTI